MSDLSRRLASQILAQAEERFLREHDWEKVEEAKDPIGVIRGVESLWTYKGSFIPRRSSNWKRIERSHAIHAAKLIIRQQSNKSIDDPTYNQDDRGNR